MANPNQPLGIGGGLRLGTGLGTSQLSQLAAQSAASTGQQTLQLGRGLGTQLGTTVTGSTLGAQTSSLSASGGLTLGGGVAGLQSLSSTSQPLGIGLGGQKTSTSGLTLGLGGQPTAGGLTLGAAKPTIGGGLNLGLGVGGTTSLTATSTGIGGALSLGQQQQQPKMTGGLSLQVPASSSSLSSSGLGTGLSLSAGSKGLSLGGGGGAGGLSLGSSTMTATTATSAGLGLGLGLATSTAAGSSASGGLGLGLTGAAGGSLLSNSSSLSSAAASAGGATIGRGLGGVNPQPTKDSGGSVGKATNQQLPDPVQTIYENFTKFIKEQKGIREEISHASDRGLKKVNEDAKTMSQALSHLVHMVKADSYAVRDLRGETVKELKHVEIAQRTRDTPPGLQHENFAPHEYFVGLVHLYERQMQVYRQQIEEMENHMASLANDPSITPQILGEILRKQHESFVGLAAQIQAIHEAVRLQKEQYLNYRRVFHKDTKDVFATRRRAKSDASKKVLAGPSPFGGMAGTAALAVANQQTSSTQQRSTLGLGLAGGGGTTSGLAMGRGMGLTGLGSTGLGVGGLALGEQQQANKQFQLQPAPQRRKQPAPKR